MAEVIDLSRVMALGVESTAGVAVPATKRMQTLKVTPQIAEQALTFVPSGDLLATVAALSQSMSKATVSGWPSFGEIVYPLSGIFGAATITTPGGGFASRQWQWTIKGTSFLTPKTFTCEYGDATANAGEQIPFFVFDGLTLTLDRKQIQLASSPFGAQLVTPFSLTALTANNDVQTVTITGTPAGGTFTLTLSGQTTAPIAYNAVASAVQTAIAALSNVGTGNVAVTGGPGPGTPYVVTFQGLLGNQLIPAMTHTDSFSGGSSPAAAVVHTTPGVAITAEPVIQPVVPNQVNVYVDSSSGSLGSTQYLRDFEGVVEFSGTQDQAWPLNSSLSSFGAIAPKIPKAQVMLTLAMDTQGRSQLANLRAGTRQYVRIEAVGPVIEGTIHYKMTIDMAVNITQPGNIKLMNGIYCRQFTGTIMDDAAWGNAMILTVTNANLGL